jgi:hypothetical protein
LQKHIAGRESPTKAGDLFIGFAIFFYVKLLLEEKVGREDTIVVNLTI